MHHAGLVRCYGCGAAMRPVRTAPAPAEIWELPRVAGHIPDARRGPMVSNLGIPGCAAGVGPINGIDCSDHPGGTSPTRAAVDRVVDLALRVLATPHLALIAGGLVRRRLDPFASIGSGDRRDRPVESARALPTLAPVVKPSRAGLSACDVWPN